MSLEKLTAKQLMFCKEYLVDLNGTQAAIRSGYSAKTANEQAARMLTKVSVKKKLKSLWIKGLKKWKLQPSMS